MKLDGLLGLSQGRDASGESPAHLCPSIYSSATSFLNIFTPKTLCFQFPSLWHPFEKPLLEFELHQAVQPALQTHSSLFFSVFTFSQPLLFLQRDISNVLIQALIIFLNYYLDYFRRPLTDFLLLIHLLIVSKHFDLMCHQKRQKKKNEHKLLICQFRQV